MKTFKFIYLSLLAVLLSGCQAEIWEPAGDNILKPVDGSIIAISMDDFTPINSIPTKAAPLEDDIPGLKNVLSKIEDLNIRVYLKDKAPLTIYCKGSTLSPSTPDPSGLNDKTQYIGNFDLTNFELNRRVKVHIPQVKSKEVSKIEVIANAGDQSNNPDWSTIKETELYDTSKGTCMMYGSATEGSLNGADKGHEECMNYPIVLKRTRAMVTVKLINNNLNKNVIITPLFMRLYNMPTSCSLQALGSSEGNKILQNDPVTMQEFAVSIGSLRGDSKDGSSIGCPHDNSPITSSTLQYCFYPFENVQGVHNQGNTSHATKYPTNINSPATAKDPNLNHNYTYLEIEADYKYYDPESPQTVKVGGTIVYRFFLGGDALSNFDIFGNTYYRINLSMSGYGGAREDGKVDASGDLVVNSEDVSWRVDMDTTDWGFEKDEYLFDCHYIDGVTRVVGTGWRFIEVVSGDGSSSWLTINIIDKNGQMGSYVNPTQIIKNNYELAIVDGTLRFNLQPCKYQSGATQMDPYGTFDETMCNDSSSNYREMRIKVGIPEDPDNFPKNPNLLKSEVIKVRQYAPYNFTSGGYQKYFMERFEEYDNQLGQAKGYPWKFENHNLTGLYDVQMNTAQYGGEPFYMYTSTTDKLSPLNESSNTIMLSYRSRYGTTSNIEGKGSAAHMCYIKGRSGILQGSQSNTYCLPSKETLKTMFEVSKTYDPVHGPMEPLYVYDNYWTISVPKNSPTETYYYPGTPDLDAKDYPKTKERMATKRVRAVYVYSSKYDEQDFDD